jgi:CRISPR-associated protein Cmr1
MLTGGAKNDERFELRASAIKGQLRFWWRVFQPLDGKRLFEAEASLFGSTSRSIGASQFRLNVDYDMNKKGFHSGTKQKKKTVNSLADLGAILGDRSHVIVSGGANWPDDWGQGLKYLLFPVIKKMKTTRPIVRPGFHFTLNFLCNNNGTAVDLLCSLWLLENFGGIGYRSRRGAGSFVVNEILINNTPIYESVNESIPFYKQPINDLNTYLKDCLKFIIDRWGKREGAPEHTSFLQGKSRIVVLRENKISEPIKLLDKIGSVMQRYRNTLPFNEARALHSAISTNDVKDVKRMLFTKPAVGLPVTYRFKHDFGKVKQGVFKGKTLDTYYEVKSCHEKEGETISGTDRRASPLLMSVGNVLNSSSPYIIMSFLPSRFLPDNHKLYFSAKKDEKKGKNKITKDVPKLSFVSNVPDYRFVNRLINDIKKDFECHEISI